MTIEKKIEVIRQYARHYNLDDADILKHMAVLFETVLKYPDLWKDCMIKVSMVIQTRNHNVLDDFIRWLDDHITTTEALESLVILLANRPNECYKLNLKYRETHLDIIDLRTFLLHKDDE